ncbi:hypothetical protein P7K49_032842 [Saguinus oedipus]|uniref:Uncharacterized protein n=1 Tax=Saguinus oedipus TaxID=9490 RepID=A0ABQ9TQZ7_SAGOE|nr:hypothetical protein P7K49_032842 [Saguinus oedipus]
MSSQPASKFWSLRQLPLNTAPALPPPPGDKDSSHRPEPPGNRPQKPAPGTEKALFTTVARHKCARASPRSGRPDGGPLSGALSMRGSRSSCPATGAQGGFLLHLCPALQGEAHPSGPVLRAGVSPPAQRAADSCGLALQSRDPCLPCARGFTHAAQGNSVTLNRSTVPQSPHHKRTTAM